MTADPKQLNPDDFSGADLEALVRGSQKFCSEPPTEPVDEKQAEFLRAVRFVESCLPD